MKTACCLAAGAATLVAGLCRVEPAHLSVDYLESPAPLGSALPRVSDAARPVLGWWLVPGGGADTNNVTQASYHIVVATSIARLATPDLWDSGVVPSPASVGVEYGGSPVAARTQAFWRVSVVDSYGDSCGFNEAVTGAWEAPLLIEPDWAGAAWITRDAPHLPPSDCSYYDDAPAPLLRRPFELAQLAAAVVRARLYVAGLGYFTPMLDGAQVGDETLAPGWTDFNATVLYSTFDVTAALAAGGAQAHVLGVALGRGWYDLAPLLFWGSKEFRAALPTGDPMARLLLAVDYADGSTQRVVSAVGAGGGWAAGGSEVLFNSIYLGTRIDRRREPVGWSTAAFDAAGWQPPYAADAGAVAALGPLRSQRVPPVRRQQPAVRPAELPPPAAAQRVLDLGRQVAGVCRFCFAPGAGAGATVSFLYGELLRADGSVNGLTSVAGQIKKGNGGPCAPTIAYQQDTYTLRGDAGGECFEPPFTWHGARFVAVNASSAAALAALDVAATRCYPLRSDVRRVGEFESSSPLLNAIHAADVNTAECNMMSVQSDCPHRERLGYGGDALMTGEAFALNFDVALFYEKRLQDYVDAQRDNGGFTETAPFVGIADAGMGGGSGPVGWQAFAPVAAHWLAARFANAPALARAWPALTRFIEFLDAAPDSAIKNGLGDWMAVEPAALPLTGLGFQLMSYAAYANVSALLGNVSQASKYAAAAAAVAASINEQYFDAASGRYAAVGVFNGTQCGQALPLFLQIVPPDAPAAAAAAVLAANLAAHGGNLQVGGFGTKWLLMALVDAGLADLAWGVMNKTSYPSFGYMLDGAANGLTNATTVWESWFASDDTYSHNHPMFSGGAEVYMYSGLAGIQLHPAAVGWDRVIFKPRPPPPGYGLDRVRARVETPRGAVSSEWSLDASSGAFTLQVCAPPGMRAEVWLPSGARLDAGTCCGCEYCDVVVAAGYAAVGIV